MFKNLTEEKEHRILIVDDDALTAMLHEKQLRRLEVPFTAVFCKNGQEALEYLEQERSYNDDFLVLLDLNMPVMSGWEFLKGIQEKECGQRIRVVVISTSTLRGDLLKALSYRQVVGFCQKPLRLENLGEITGLKRGESFREIRGSMKPGKFR